MIIKNSTTFFLQKVYNKTNNGECQIRMRVRWNGNVYLANVGYTIASEKWTDGRCRRNTSNTKGISATDINHRLTLLESYVLEVFKSYEVADVMPTLSDFRNEMNKRLGKCTTVVADDDFNKVLTKFIVSQEITHSWTMGTTTKFNTLRHHINEMHEGVKMCDFNSSFYEEFIGFLLNRGLRNTYILKFWKIFTWFLRWADKNGYLADSGYRNFAPRLKTVRDKEVVYLTWEELMKVYNYTFPESKTYLEKIRDVFCFQCFTSLRYSDVAKLKRTDIVDGVIKVVTEKTGDSINIELNKYSSSILERYSGNERPLPVVTNQRMNLGIKEACFLAGINAPITLVYYKGSKRIEETHPKYELVTSHTGRRTFICNALTMGIPPSLVMEWTGHSDYKAMKPYIKIADTEKAKAMKLFDDK